MAESDLPKIENRKQLACVLRLASELEHLLACQYLFAAFSMRKTLADFPAGGDETEKRLVLARNQRWEFKVMQIARQEMEHLGIVNNLLGAIGEDPWFDRPNFPLPRTVLPIDVPFVLQRFGRPTLERFLAYERPDYLEVPESWRGGGPEPGCVPAQSCGDIVFADVQQLYEEIALAFDSLPPGEIFRGDSRRQVDNTDSPAFGLGVTMMPVTDRETAAAAIALILEQGEGIGDYPLGPDSHFQSFNAILQEHLAAPSRYEPALPVVENPMLRAHNDCAGTTVVTHEHSRRVMALFNAGYHVMLGTLRAFFLTFRGRWGPTSGVAGLIPKSELQQRARNAALLEISFFPLMTMVVRPLGDLLTRLPAHDDGSPERAGPGFELGGGTAPIFEDFPPVLERLSAMAREVADGTAGEPERRQLTDVADNLSRMTQNFVRVWSAVD